MTLYADTGCFFAVMHRLGLIRAASFDHHFATYRYGPSGRRAFEVVR